MLPPWKFFFFSLQPTVIGNRHQSGCIGGWEERTHIDSQRGEGRRDQIIFLPSLYCGVHPHPNVGRRMGWLERPLNFLFLLLDPKFQKGARSPSYWRRRKKIFFLTRKWMCRRREEGLLRNFCYRFERYSNVQFGLEKMHNVSLM